MPVRVALATEPGKPDWPNEDFAAAAPGAAVLLDGCTRNPQLGDTGCVHGVAWYARTLGGTFLAAITSDPAVPLEVGLATAVEQVGMLHGHTCDLDRPGTPATTVTAVRAGETGFDLLALADSSVVADYRDGRPPLVLTDDHRAIGASAEAAKHARTRTLPRDGLRGIALLSDGATRITDTYGMADWPDVLAVIRDSGPAALIRRVRDIEDTDPQCHRWRRGKPRDDATVVYWHEPTAPL